ncbi:MAG: hypothetical protein K1X28_04420 [Parachlamydiales bacterium]|nr:hypothetical protein [Parachlamydiales bacterium]
MKITEIASPQIQKPDSEEVSEDQQEKTAAATSKIAKYLLMELDEANAEFELSWDKSF